MPQHDKDSGGGLALVPHLSSLPSSSDALPGCQAVRDLHTLSPDDLFYRVLFGLLPTLHLQYLDTTTYTSASDTLYALGSTLAWAVSSGTSAVGQRARTVSMSLAQQMEPRVRSLSNTIYEEARKRSSSVDIDQVKTSVSTTVSTLASNALPYVQSTSQAFSTQTSAAAGYVASWYQSYMQSGASSGGGGNGGSNDSGGNPYMQHATTTTVGREASSSYSPRSNSNDGDDDASTVRDITRPPATAPHVHKGTGEVVITSEHNVGSREGEERMTLYPSLFDPDALPSAPPLPPDVEIAISRDDSSVGVQYPVL